MRKFYNKTIILLLVSIPFVLFSFSDQILSYAFNKYLIHFSGSALQSDLQHDGIQSDGNGWTVKNPRLTSKLKGEGLDFSAQSLTIKIVPRWLEREADLHLHLVGPELEVDDQISDLGNVLLKALSPVGFLHLRPQVHIENGQLRISKGENEKEILYFTLKAVRKKELSGELVASTDDPELQAPNLTVTFSNPEKHRYLLDVQTDEFKAPLFKAIGRFFYPDLDAYDVQEGAITGHIGIELPREGKPFAFGDVTLKQVGFYHRGLDFKGKIPEAQIHIGENKDPRTNGEEFPRTIGHVELTEGALLVFEKKGVPFCTLEDLKGTLYFHTVEGARLNLTGTCLHHHQTAQLKAQGLARFGVKDGNALDLKIQMQQQDLALPPAMARFVTRELGAQFKFIEMTFDQIGAQEFEFLQLLLTPHVPQIAQAHLIQGKMDASVLAYMKGMQVSDFKIERLKAENLDFALDRWETKAHIDSLSGNLEINLASLNPLETLNADLQISGGHCVFKGLCDLTDLKTDLIVRKGVIQESIALAQFSGLKGKLLLNGFDPEGEIVKIDFTGPFKGLAGIVPEKLRKALEAGWGEDLIGIKAGIKRIEKGLFFSGILDVTDHKTHVRQHIDWRFDLKRRQKEHIPLGDQFWQSTVQELWNITTGNQATQAALLAGREFERAIDIGSFKISNGHFKSDQVVLEKYIASLLFERSTANLSGIGDLEGQFDQSGIFLLYQLHQAVYELPGMKWTIENLGQREVKNEGRHYFDFVSDTSFGQLVLNGAKVFDKRSNLFYTDLQAHVVWADDQLQFKGLKTQSCGIKFGGEILLDLRNPLPGYSTTRIAINDAQGTFSEVQQYFSHFENLRFLEKLPLEGEISLREGGALMLLEHTPGDWKIQSSIHGSLQRGLVLSNSPDLKIEELQCNFDYEQEHDTFFIKDLHAAVKVGGEENERYSLSGEKIHFTNCTEGSAEFDVLLGNETRDIVRIAGKAMPTQNGAHPGSLDLILDKQLTHFGDVHPERFEMTFRDWNHIDTLQVDFGLSLATMLLDVQTLSRTGLLFLPKNLINELNSFKNGTGEFQVSIDYDDKTSLLNYKATATNVAVGEHCYQNIALQGKKKGVTWAIDQLLLDDTSIAADLTRTPHSWKVNFMGLRFGQSLLVGLEGDYRDADKVFEGKVNLFEADLSRLKEWPAFSAVQENYDPKGILRATGQLHLKPLPTGKRNWRLELLMSGSLKGAQLKDLHFQDIPSISIHYVTDRGVAVRGLRTSLKEGENNKVLGLLDLEKFDFDTAKEQLSLEGFRFNFPVENLFFTLQKLHEAFPELFSEEVAAVVGRIKDSNNFEGAVDFKKSKEGVMVELYLPEGKYRYNEQWHEINNFKLVYNMRELKMLSQYRFNDHLFWLYLKTAPSTLKKGVILLADHHPEMQKPLPGQYPLRIEWSIDPEKGFAVHRAQGFLAGMEVDLAADSAYASDEESIHLKGQIAFNPSQAGCLISQEFADSCKRLLLGNGYFLRGAFSLSKNQNLRFTGQLEGREFVLKGYQLQNMSAQVVYAPPYLTIKDLKIVDNAGNAQIDLIQMTKEGDLLWKMAIPKIVLTNFKPSLLRENGDPPRVSKPLLVRSIEIQNVTGWASEPQTWTGKGVLQFANPPKKNLQNTILAIPAEILTLIGLDPTVLNPISGNVLFDIREGKFLLTKFKDMYSEGRHSKFHLSHQKISTVDFEGNLDVQIRMKQYNLVFKLAELLTFNINGTLLKPTYSLNKQRKL